MKKLVYVALLCMSVCVSPSFGVLYIDVMGLDVGASYFYDYVDGGTSQFVLSNNASAGSEVVTVDHADIHIFGAASHEYDFTGTMTVTASNETGKGQLPGSNPGEFNEYAIFSSTGGATLTLYATELKKKSTGDIIYTNTVLVEAQITALPGADVADSWYLLEADGDPDKYNSVDLAYEITGGAFFDGGIFKLLDFEATWSLPYTKPEGAAFDDDLHLDTPKLDISAQVPEPATLVLMGLGGILLRRKK